MSSNNPEHRWFRLLITPYWVILMGNSLRIYAFSHEKGLTVTIFVIPQLVLGKLVVGNPSYSTTVVRCHFVAMLNIFVFHRHHYAILYPTFGLRTLCPMKCSSVSNQIFVGIVLYGSQYHRGSVLAFGRFVALKRSHKNHHQALIIYLIVCI